MQYEAPKLIAMDEVVHTSECAEGIRAADSNCSSGYCATAGTCAFGCQALTKYSGNFDFQLK
ncbi:MAG: hypothetical protein NC238_16145 [Dehalobacter sp.]|nr:hypothetical protein [Dehalobacter sp.]